MSKKIKNKIEINVDLRRDPSASGKSKANPAIRQAVDLYKDLVYFQKKDARIVLWTGDNSKHDIIIY